MRSRTSKPAPGGPRRARVPASFDAGAESDEPPPGKDLYAVLGVPREASAEDIKRAYKLLALRHHPDKAGDDAAAVETFQRVRNAFGVLSDERKRRYYDDTGDTEEIDVSAADFVVTFKATMDEMLGGLTVQDMLEGLSNADIRRMPPFPFPERLFPAGTFPSGMRFSADFKLPPSVEELLEQSGPEALHALFAAASPGSSSRANQGDTAAGSGSDGFSGSGSSDWHTDVNSDSDTDSHVRDLPNAADVSNSVLASPGTHVGDAAPSGRNSSSGAAAASRGDTPGRRWLDAARAGHLGLLQRLLPSFPELWAHRGPGLGHTALHWAAARDDSAMLKWLLVQPGADVGACNNVGATALHAAAGNDAVASLQVLTAAGADLLARDEGEETPHDVATRLKRVAALAFLDAAAREAAGARQSAHVVQCPAPTPARPPRPAGEQPLPQASEADAGVDRVRIGGSASELQEPPDVGDIDRQLGRRWLDAARSGDVSCLSDLLNSEPCLLYYWGAGTNYGFSGHSALHWAAAKGHADALRALLRAGANPDVPNHGGGRPLHAAAANGQTQCARMLLLHGGACASLHNGLEETPRELALISGHTDTAQAIEEAARAAQLRDVLPADASEFRGAAVRAAQAALAAAGQDVRAFTERDDLFAAAKQLVASLPPLAVLRRSELVPVPSAKPAACVPPTGAADPSPAAAAVSTSFDSDEAGTGSAAESKLASAAKERGNTAFAALEYSRSAAAYTVALRFDPGNAVLLSNRSAALAAMGKYEAALEDAERAVRAAPKWGKAHARRGAALVGLGQAGEAVKAYAAGLAVEPDAAYLREGLAEARAAIRSAQARYSAMWGERPSETHTSDA